MDVNEFDKERPKRSKKKAKPKVYSAKIIMKSKTAIGVLFKGHGIRITTEREFPEGYVDVHYVSDIGQRDFECWIQ